MMKRLFLLIALTGLGNCGFAQNFLGLVQEGRHNVSLGVNANPILNLNADYLLQTNTDKKLLKRYAWIGHVNLPLFTQEKMDFDVKLGAVGLFQFSERLKMVSGLTWGFSRTEDINGRYLNSGFKMDLLPGYYGKKWVFAPHLSVNYQPWINIKHLEYARQAFEDLYPNGSGAFKSPKDGWFYQNSLSFQTGLGIAFTQPCWQVNMTGGFQYQPNSLGFISFPDLGIMPFYFGVNLMYRFQSNSSKL